MTEVMADNSTIKRRRKMTEVMADNSTIKRQDIKSLLCGENRDFVVRNNGDQVKVRDLEEKVIGLYFSASWGGCCDSFTPKLIKAYDELSQNHSNFEVVFVLAECFIMEESFWEYFSGMPWVAIPFADFATRNHLMELFATNTKYEMPNLVVLDKNGEVANAEGVMTVTKYGSEAYPFTQERIDLINTNLEDAKRNQTLRSVLVSSSRDFLISNNGNKVPVSDLEGKIVGLYFSDFSASSNRFNSKLVKMCKRLKDRGENFEVVLVPVDDDESSFQLRFATVPWLAIPFKDKSCERLGRYFELEDIPMLAVIGSDGKTLVPNAVELVEKHGDEAYPFSLQKMEELSEKEKARMESQNLESLLVSWDGDYVIGNGDVKIPVSNLVGKNILLYFSADEGGRACEGFLPKLIEAYNTIKAKETNFEVIFLSRDRDHAAFDNHFSWMPWVAVPFGDSRETSLSKMLNIEGRWAIPALRAIGPTGRVITTDAAEMIKAHGAEAYPFDEERLKELEVAADEAAKRWPERLRHKEHALVRTKRGAYDCDGCGEDGDSWAFCCEACNLTMHPKCALEEDPEKEGYVGDTDVRYCGDGWTFYRERCFVKCPLREEEEEEEEEEEDCECEGGRGLCRMHDLPPFWSLRAIGPTGRAIPVDIARACFYGARREELEVGAKEEKKWPERVQHPLHKVYACGEIGDGWSFYCNHCICKEVTLKEDPEEDFGALSCED